MPSRLKEFMVRETVERYRDASSLVAISYERISAEEATNLRRGMREKQVDIRLVKNRVTRRAFAELGRSDFGELLDGEVAVISAESLVEASKAAAELARERQLDVKGGWADGKVVTREEIQHLSTLPPRKVLLAQIAGLAAGALRSLVGMIDAPGAALARVINAWNEKPERKQPQTNADGSA